MSRTTSWFAGRSGACIFLVLMAVACGTSDAPSDTSSAVVAPAGTTYLTTEFVPPLEVTVPAWLPREPSADEPNFLTWIGEGVWVDRAVRFLVPVNLYEPGSAAATAPPANYLAYLAYLRTQDQYGAHFGDEMAVTVGGRPATVMTATTTTSLDGSLGCPADGIPAAGCFGLQPELTLRIAVIDANDTTLLAWARAITGTADAAQEFADFENMLANLQFR
jgi:hypothetical protein